MPRFIDMSLRLRTFLAFGLILLVTIGLGGFALYQLSVVDAASDALGAKAMPSLSESGQILRSVINFRREEANRLLSVTEEDGRYREKLMGDYSDLAKKMRALYHPATPDEQAEIGQFDALWPKYMDSTQTILAKLKEHDADGAHKLYVGENRVQFDTVHAAMDKEVDQNTQAGRVAYDVVNAATDHARLGI